VGFCLWLWCSSFIFFCCACGKKMNVLQVCWLTKTMTKNLTATPNPNAFGWGLSRAVGGLFGFVLLMMIYSAAGL
jgi:hypothetical protein